MKHPVLWGVGVVAFMILCVVGYRLYSQRFAPTPETSSEPKTVVVPQTPSSTASAPEVVATGLDTPWTIAFLPNGEMLATERKGTLRVLGSSPRSIQVPNVVESGESGLTGMTLHPEFSKNQYLYLYYTAKIDGKTDNRVVRYHFDGDSLKDPTVIVSGIPSGSNHNGGQIAFGPDGKLYVCTGDAEKSASAQDKNILGGKILRVNDDGSIPSDNPFGNSVYSYGHRNPQGIVWDEQGRLWATEHGRSGLSTGYDELNLVEKGENYGWPTIQGNQQKEGIRSPIAQSGPTTTWAPAGIVSKNGTLYFAGLRGQAIYSTTITDGKAGMLQAHFKETYGRLRAMVLGPDGAIYFSTSNRDGRGAVKEGDDKVYRWMP